MMWNCISFQPCAHVCHCIKDVRGLLLLYFSFFHTPSLTQTFLSWICLTVNRFQFLIFQNEIYIPGANRGSRTSWSGRACKQSWQWLFFPCYMSNFMGTLQNIYYWDNKLDIRIMYIYIYSFIYINGYNYRRVYIYMLYCKFYRESIYIYKTTVIALHLDIYKLYIYKINTVYLLHPLHSNAICPF